MCSDTPVGRQKRDARAAGWVVEVEVEVEGMRNGRDGRQRGEKKGASGSCGQRRDVSREREAAEASESAGGREGSVGRLSTQQRLKASDGTGTATATVTVTATATVREGYFQLVQRLRSRRAPDRRALERRGRIARESLVGKQLG